jgi:hypothetical protein
MKEYESHGVKVTYLNKNSRGVFPDKPFGLEIYGEDREGILYMISVEKAISIRNLLHKAIIDMSVDTGESAGILL